MFNGTTDRIEPVETPLADGERLREVFLPDRGVYWVRTAVGAGIGAIVAGAALYAFGNPYPWLGPVAAVLGIGGRAYLMRARALGARWRLTDRRLLGPEGRIVPLGQIEEIKTFLGDVVLVTRGGDKHLMHHFADTALVIAAIENAQRGAR